MNGSYALEVTVNGCTDTSSCYLILSTDIAGAPTTLPISVYPNPVVDALTIQTPDEGAKQVEVLDITGKVVLCYQFTGVSAIISFGELADGVYIVKVTGENSSAVTRIQKQ